jgi:ABC-2 type transport system permease protein
MVVWIDQQFSRNLEAGKKADVQLILDGRRSNTTQILAGYVGVMIDRFNQDFANKRDIPSQETKIIPRSWFNPNLIYYWFNVPNLSGVITMLVGLLVTALSVARERELGTFDQLLVSPISPIEILIGKSLPGIFIGMTEGTIIICAAIFIFQIPFTGSLLLLYMNMLVFICSVVGVGLFISSLCQTQQQAILGTFAFMSPAVSLSGYATPIEAMPNWLQSFTYINPLRYYLVVAKGIFLKNMSFDIVWENTWPLALIAIFNLTAATLFFRKRLQ